MGPSHPTGGALIKSGPDGREHEGSTSTVGVHLELILVGETVRAGGHGCALLRNALLVNHRVPQRFHVPVSVTVGEGETGAKPDRTAEFAIEPVEQIGRVERDEIERGALPLIGKRCADRPFDPVGSGDQSFEEEVDRAAIERLSPAEGAPCRPYRRACAGR